MNALECSQHYTFIFQTLKGKKTLESEVISNLNLNSSKLLCKNLLSARMKMIQSKMKEGLQCFSYYKPMGIFPDAQPELTPQSLVRSDQISNSFEMW